VQSRDQLLRDVWEYDSLIDTRTVDTHMRRLREKLGPAGNISTPSAVWAIASSNPESAVWPALAILAVACLIGAAFVVARANCGASVKQGALKSKSFEDSSKSFRRNPRPTGCVVRQHGEGVLVLDGDGRVQVANRAFAELFKHSGRPRGKVLLEAIRSHEVAELVSRVNLEGRVLAHEMKLPGPEERRLQVNAAAISSNDRRRLGTILVFHDLTRVRQLERTREEFVANVSHELRTPLSLIKGYVETLLGGAKDNPEVATKFLQTIGRNAQRLDC